MNIIKYILFNELIINFKQKEMKKLKIYSLSTFSALLLSATVYGQTNVFDDVIAVSPDHTYLEAALIQENLVSVLQDPTANLTVFAPTNSAFDDLAVALDTDIAGLLALPNLDDILKYHVLGIEVPSTAVTNGAIVQPLSTTNTLKLTVTANDNVFVNQAQVTAFDIVRDNGTVHVLDAIVLPVETVVDVALANGFTTLATAVTTAELLPVLTDPLSNFTVFAPTNEAFDDLAFALDTDIDGILALPNLADVLAYHVLGIEVPSTAVTNGAIVQPLSTTNTLKLTVTANDNVFVNQAQVTLFDIVTDNGTVHVLDAVVLPFETVVDVAIDNGFTTLATAVATAELLPVLTDPLSEFTVFAPTNAAFDDLAVALNTDIGGILALPNLADVLAYHVVEGTVLSTQLTAGPVATVNGEDVIVSLTNGVLINDATVTLVDVLADNGVVHVIDEVLLPPAAGIIDNSTSRIVVYPNPFENQISLSVNEITSYSILDLNGKVLKSGSLSVNGNIDLSELNSGSYLLNTLNNSGSSVVSVVKR
jgi:uncharacterized surface protein with fasciclin (FAS1) repeats